MKRAKNFAAYAIGFLAISLLTVACAGDKKNYLATPETTINTYLDQARTLSKMADPLAYSRAIDCFAREAIVWWEANANNLLDDPSIVDGASGSKREAIVFANYVLPKGPSFEYGEPNIKRISMSGHKAMYKVNGVKLALVKEGANWRFQSMFGMDSD